MSRHRNTVDAARVVQIWNAGGQSLTTLAHRFNVSRNVIAGILHRAKAKGETVAKSSNTFRNSHRRGAPDPQRDAAILRLWNAGDTTYEAVGDLLGIGRGVVSKSLLRARKRGIYVRSAVTGQAWRTEPKKPIKKRVTTVTESLNLTLQEVQECNGCRWPSGDKPNLRFCGATPSKGPYCDRHRLVAYTNVQPINEAAE